MSHHSNLMRVAFLLGLGAVPVAVFAQRLPHMQPTPGQPPMPGQPPYQPPHGQPPLHGHWDAGSPMPHRGFDAGRR